MTTPQPTIRPEIPDDATAIEAVTVAAFREATHGDHTEQHIVRALRAAGRELAELNPCIHTQYI